MLISTAILELEWQYLTNLKTDLHMTQPSTSGVCLEEMNTWEAPVHLCWRQNWPSEKSRGQGSAWGNQHVDESGKYYIWTKEYYSDK